MDQLLAKLTILSYDIFGVFLPGIFGGLFFVVWWYALGPLATCWTYGEIPQLTAATAKHMLDSVNLEIGIGIGIPVLVASYFVGNTLVWISRSGKPDSNDGALHLLSQSIVFRVPKPEHSFSPALRPLFDLVQKKFAQTEEPLNWRQMYPVVKNYLAQNGMYSLVSTYQNKYTFHRSMVMASAALFWLAAAGLIGGGITHCINGCAPKWGWLVAIMLTTLFLVRGFSDSYRLNWEMFANTIITEAYALIYGPKNEQHPSRTASS